MAVSGAGAGSGSAESLRPKGRLRPPACPAAEASEVSSRKICSRDRDSRLISRIGRSAPAQAWKTASLGSAPSAGVRRSRAAPASPQGSGATSATPGTPESRTRPSSGAALSSRVMAGVPASSRSSWAGVPWATSRPWWMIKMWSQTSWTSERMWELRITVCSWASSRIRARISRICLGSRPTVGSSRIRMCGKPISAWASPTRWR